MLSLNNKNIDFLCSAYDLSVIEVYNNKMYINSVNNNSTINTYKFDNYIMNNKIFNKAIVNITKNNLSQYNCKANFNFDNKFNRNNTLY